MRWDHTTGLTATPAEIKGFYNLEKSGLNMGNIPEALLTKEGGWKKEREWRCTNKDGSFRMIPYSEVTHQHWSNIYHHFNENGVNQELKLIATTQIVKHFDGKILPQLEFLLKTDDGVDIYDSRNLLFVVDKLSGVINKVYPTVGFKVNNFRFYYFAESKKAVTQSIIIKTEELDKIKRAKRKPYTIESRTDDGAIKSILRKNDDVVFALNDYAYASLDQMCNADQITEFREIDDSVCALIGKELVEVSMLRPAELLLTTDDGVKIFDWASPIFTLNTSTWTQGSTHAHMVRVMNRTNIKLFSNQPAQIKFEKENRNLISIARLKEFREEVKNHAMPSVALVNKVIEYINGLY